MLYAGVLYISISSFQVVGVEGVLTPIFSVSFMLLNLCETWFLKTIMVRMRHGGGQTGFHRVFVVVLVGMDEFDVMMVVLRFNGRINARDLEGLVSEWRMYLDTPENRGKIGLE